MTEFNKLQHDMLGQELPEQEIIEGQPQEAAKPEPVSEPEPIVPESEPTPAEPELDPITKVFKEEGLDRQFKDPTELIRKQREINRYVTRLEQENASYRRPTEQPKAEPKHDPVTGDDLYADPNIAFERLGVAKKEDVAQTIERIDRIEARQRFDEAVSVIGGIDELKDVAEAWRRGEASSYDRNDIFNRMNQLYVSNPGLHGQTPSQVFPLLYNAVLGERRGVVASTTPTVDPKKKEAATTASGKSTKITGQKDASYYDKLSTAELEKELGYVEPT